MENLFVWLQKTLSASQNQILSPIVLRSPWEKCRIFSQKSPKMDNWARIWISHLYLIQTSSVDLDFTGFTFHEGGNCRSISVPNVCTFSEFFQSFRCSHFVHGKNWTSIFREKVAWLSFYRRLARRCIYSSSLSYRISAKMTSLLQLHLLGSKETHIKEGRALKVPKKWKQAAHKRKIF